MRVLFLAPRHPDPALRGDQRRVLGLLRPLAQRAEITLLAYGDPAAPALDIEGIRSETVPLRPLDVLRANLRRPDPRLPGQTRLYLTRAMAAAVGRELARQDYDVVHVTLARLGPYLPPAGTAHRHIDLIDSLALNMRTRAQASRAPARQALAVEAAAMGRYEARLVAAADSASVVAEADRLAVAGLEGAAVIPNGVDADAFTYREPADRPPVLIYFGNLGYFHALEPARHVAREVLPLVRAEHPEAELQLVGARPSAAVRALADEPGVRLVGQVPSMADALHHAAVAVLPVFSGSGIKNKVLEAFCAGTPVVANRAAMEGIAARPGEHYLQAEDPHAEAAAVGRLLEDRATGARIASAARGLVERDHAWSAQAERLLALYQRA